MKKNNVAIVTDAVADLPAGWFHDNDVQVIKCSFVLSEREYAADADWESLDAKSFFKSLRAGEFVATLPATELEIRSVFSDLVNEGKSVVYIACPEVLSTTINKARKIADEISAENPDAEIFILDAFNFSCGQGMVVLEACKLRDQGKSAREIVDGVMPIRNKILEYCSPETLTYLSEANKVKSYTATLGNLMDIKPIIVSDMKGRQVTLKKVKGRENCLNEILRKMVNNSIDLENQTIFIAHADDKKTAEHVEKLMEERGIRCKNIEYVYFGPIGSAWTGPGSVAIFTLGNEITFERSGR